MPIAPVNPLFQPLLFEAGFLVVSAVLGMALFNLRAKRGSKPALIQVMLAGILMAYAWRRLPHLVEVWMLLAPASLFMVVLGHMAGAGWSASRRPSMEQQIEDLTGEHVEWDELRPHRGLENMRNRNRPHRGD